MSKPKTKKSCVVPQCKNTTTNAPEKLFFVVPMNLQMRKKWIKAMRRLDPFGDKSNVHCCEDHFDIETDMENYVKFKLVGGRLSLKTGVIPHKFACQEQQDEKQTKNKRKRLEPINIALNEDISGLDNVEEPVTGSKEINDVDPLSTIEMNYNNDNRKEKTKTQSSKKKIGKHDIESFEEDSNDNVNELSEAVDCIEEPDSDKSNNLKTYTSIKRAVTRGKRAKNIGHNIEDIIIDYDNLDKFGEQIVILLKRIPKKLCRELQDSIVTLVKTVINKCENKTDKNVTGNTNQIKTPRSRPVLSSIGGRNTKRKKTEEVTNVTMMKEPIEKEMSVPVLSSTLGRHTKRKKTKEVKKKIEEPGQERQIMTSTNLSTNRNIPTEIIFPKPIKIPIELVGIVDCVKQEVLDPGESINTEQDQCIEDITSELTLSYSLKTDIKEESND